VEKIKMKKYIVGFCLVWMSGILYAAASIPAEEGISRLAVLESINGIPLRQVNSNETGLEIFNAPSRRVNNSVALGGSPTYQFGWFNVPDSHNEVKYILDDGTYQINNLNMLNGRVVPDLPNFSCFYNLIFDVQGTTINNIRAAGPDRGSSPSCNLSQLTFEVLGNTIKVNYSVL
jgi:hypothetical protein